MHSHNFHYMARLSQPWVCERCVAVSECEVYSGIQDNNHLKYAVNGFDGVNIVICFPSCVQADLNLFEPQARYPKECV